MRFNPKDENEILLDKLLPDGEYNFIVKSAIQKKSKNGNDMIELQLEVLSPNGRQALIFDYLTPSIIYKIKHFCDSVGLQKEYEEGLINPEQLTGKKGQLKLKIKIDKSGEYGPKNSVVDYMSGLSTKSSGLRLPPTTVHSDDFKDDEVPF